MSFRLHEDLDLQKSMVIYKITNIINNKIYIGQTTTSLQLRLRNYLNRIPNVYFLRSIKKYSSENFELSIIDQGTTIEELNKKEEYWISFFKACNPAFGYNQLPGGDNRKMHENTKVILSKRCSGWHHTKEAKEKIKKAAIGRHVGKHYSETHRKNLSIAHMGIYPSEKTRQLQSEAQKKRKITWGSKISITKTRKIDTSKLIQMYNEKIPIEKISNFFNLSISALYKRINSLQITHRKPRLTDHRVFPVEGMQS